MCVCGGGHFFSVSLYNFQKVGGGEGVKDPQPPSPPRALGKQIEKLINGEIGRIINDVSNRFPKLKDGNKI